MSAGYNHGAFCLLLVRTNAFFKFAQLHSTRRRHDDIDSRFESLELKMLRVSVSSFYDYLALVIKTFQEFDR